MFLDDENLNLSDDTQNSETTNNANNESNADDGAADMAPIPKAGFRIRIPNL